MEGRVPPHDTDAEQAVLGSMIIDKNALNSAMDLLKEEDFYREDNAIIFGAILSISSRVEPVDIITLKSELQSIGKLDAVGGLDYITALPDKVPTTANVDKYIKIVQDKSMMRRLINTANNILKLGYDETEEPDVLMESAQKEIYDTVQAKNQKGYTQVKDILVNSFTQLEQLYNKKQHITGIASGFTNLDWGTTGFHNSELIIVAARPGMGKSAFAMNIAEHAAIDLRVPTVIFSLEMSKEQVVNRMLASRGLVDSQRIRSGRLEDDDWTKLAEASGEMSNSPLFIDDTPGISMMEIRARCRKLKLEQDLGLVVVDYLQLITGSGKRGASRDQEIGEISRGLKILAKELNVPVIALSQLSRGADRRDDHKPVLSDLRESGSIEQDADMVIFIHRDEYYNKEDSEEKGIAHIMLSKNRSGAQGDFEVGWIGQYTKFMNLDRNHEE